MNKAFQQKYLAWSLEIAKIRRNQNSDKEILEKLESGEKSYFLTGKAGTGKSTMINNFIKQTSKNVAVLAPTGVAAQNVKGVTIHSFFGLPMGIIKPKNIHPDEYQEELWRSLDAIIIDEISMVRADVMDAIDFSLRRALKDERPFAGKKMIFAGDLFQLPPVVSKDVRAYFYGDEYVSPYFFDAHVFTHHPNLLETITLQKVIRQDDSLFKYVLNLVRDRQITEKELEYFNRNVAIMNGEMPERPSVYLATTNEIVDRQNAEALAELDGDVQEYHAKISDYIAKKDYPASEVLRLKPGAQIMMLTNVGSAWKNGTLGEVVEASPKCIKVSLNGIVHEVERHTWEIMEYQYDRETGKIKESIIGIFEQYPIALSWAMTIHKSQGKTFDSIAMDTGTGAFAHGQVYVALSRCRTLEKVQMAKPLEMSDIIVDPRVIEFMKTT